MADTQKKPTKTVALITYVIAVVCLVLGLLLPFGPIKGDGYNAVIMQIPHALECFGVKWDAGAALTYTYTVQFWGGTAFELGGLFILLYSLLTVVALGVLIAVIFGNKEKDTSINCAGVIEVISTVILSVLLFMQMSIISMGYSIGDYSWSIALLVAFGGPLLMLFIQSIYHKGSSGVIKMVLVILGAVTVVFCLFSFAAIIPQLAEALNKILNGNTQLLDWANESNPYLGSVWYHLSVPFLANYGDFLKELGGMNATVSVFMLVLGVLIIVNFLLDVCGLAKKTQRWMLLANLIRYGLEVLVALLILILGGVVAKHSVGVICYVLLILAIVLVAINIIRFVTFKEEAKEAANENEGAAQNAPKAKAAKAPAKPQPDAQAYEQPYDGYYEQPYEEQPYQDENEQAQPQAQPQAQAQPRQDAAPVAAQSGNVYSPVIYNGPRDKFIDTLTNEQRIEFARTFLEHRSGEIKGIPDYVVDGDNDTFFRSLFIYYARVRGLVSDGLMNKFYEMVKSNKQ